MLTNEERDEKIKAVADASAECSQVTGEILEVYRNILAHLRGLTGNLDADMEEVNALLAKMQGCARQAELAKDDAGAMLEEMRELAARFGDLNTVYYANPDGTVPPEAGEKDLVIKDRV